MRSTQKNPHGEASSPQVQATPFRGALFAEFKLTRPLFKTPHVYKPLQHLLRPITMLPMSFLIFQFWRRTLHKTKKKKKKKKGRRRNSINANNINNQCMVNFKKLLGASEFGCRLTEPGEAQIQAFLPFFQTRPGRDFNAASLHPQHSRPRAKSVNLHPKWP